MFRAICIALCVLILSACSAGQLFLSLHSSNVINPDDQHRALSLYLKIFQVQSPQDFQEKSFDTIWNMKTSKNILAVKTLLVQSNDTQTVTINLDPKTKFIVVIADFRKSESIQKLIIPIKGDSLTEKQISILIQANQIELGGSS